MKNTNGIFAKHNPKHEHISWKLSIMNLCKFLFTKIILEEGVLNSTTSCEVEETTEIKCHELA